MTPDLLVVVLAGGEGRRMGGRKPLRLFRGQSLLAHALDRAFSWSPRVVVSVRSSDQVGPISTPVLLDAPDIGGPLAGLSAALTFAGREGASRLLTLPCDMPVLPDDLARRLDKALVAGLGAAMASCAGRLHPVCTVWDVAAQAGLPPYLAGGGSSLRGFAEAVGMTTAVWAAECAPAFENINTPIDLARLSAGARD
ncbi:MAG: molybdenum cofactor guanylyltransferase [Caulobacter sp.]